MKKNKPDEVFNNGIIEISRYGNKLQARNILSESQHRILLESLASSCDE